MSAQACQNKFVNDQQITLHIINAMTNLQALTISDRLQDTKIEQNQIMLSTNMNQQAISNEFTNNPKTNMYMHAVHDKYKLMKQ
jgi:hypothetical protein